MQAIGSGLVVEPYLASVVLGTGKMLTDFKLLRRIAIE